MVECYEGLKEGWGRRTQERCSVRESKAEEGDGGESGWIWRTVVPNVLEFDGIRGDGGEAGRLPRIVYGEKKGLSKEAIA